MRLIKSLLFVLAGVMLLLTACDKAKDLQTFSTGQSPVLSASATTLTPPASDSDKVVLRLNWTDPKLATDSANVKYTIEIDSATKNFTSPNRFTVMGNRMVDSFTAKQLNTLLLARGYAFNAPVDMDVRVIGSYANNNDRQVSNTVRIRMTPYKIPPRVALPASNRLFIVGSATDGGWNNPVPTPSQELTRIDETTWGGIFQMSANQQFLLLPVNGDWSNKYSVANNTLAGLNAGGDFGFNLNDNFPGPSAAGLYKVIVDFQTGRFTVTPFNQQHGLPTELYIVGGATPGGWNNPVPVPAQRFTRVNSTKFEITLPLTAGQEYLLLPTNGDWGRKYGVASTGAPNISMGSTLVPEGQNIPSPTVSGNYKITVDFIDNSYKLVRL